MQLPLHRLFFANSLSAQLPINQLVYAGPKPKLQISTVMAMSDTNITNPIVNIELE
jgi:hypothetical protein